MTWLRYFLYLSLYNILFFASCSSSRLATKSLVDKVEYNFGAAEVHTLSTDLEEVSGLCYDYMANNLLAIEDEHGVFYLLDKSNGATIKKDSVYKAGDYEGVANSKEHYYILKSSGTIYKFDKSNLENKPVKIKSFLNKKFDAEGLTYAKTEHLLLICAKENPARENKNERFIYAYDLYKEEMNEEPYLVIDRDEMANLILDKYSASYAEDKFEKILDAERKELHLGPSGIAIHPKTNNIYILSSKSKVLLTYDRLSKRLIDINKLDKNILPQPEGICFDNKGKLYISSEAREGKPHLVILKPL